MLKNTSQHILNIIASKFKKQEPINNYKKAMHVMHDNQSNILNMRFDGYKIKEIASKLNISYYLFERLLTQIRNSNPEFKAKYKLAKKTKALAKTKTTKIKICQHQILKLTSDGYKSIDIANKLEVNHNTFMTQLYRLKNSNPEFASKYEAAKKANKKILANKKINQIIELTSNGFLNKEISKILGFSNPTLNKYIKLLYTNQDYKKQHDMAKLKRKTILKNI